MIHFQICEKIHRYSSTNMVGHHITYSSTFLNFYMRYCTSTVRANLTNKPSAQNAGNGISGLQILNIFWATMPPDLRSNAPPLENLHPL